MFNNLPSALEKKRNSFTLRGGVGCYGKQQVKPTTMIATPPPSPSMTVTSSYLSGRCIPCPAAPPSSPCPSISPPPSPSLRGAPLSQRPRNSSLCPNPGTDTADHRRHSWRPGAGSGYGCPLYQQRSVSLEGFDPEEMEQVLIGALGKAVLESGRDPRRAPITLYGQDMDSLLSLTEEEADPQYFSSLEEQSSQLQGFSASAPSLCASLSLRQLSLVNANHTHSVIHYPQHQYLHPRIRSYSTASSCSTQYQGSSLRSVFGGSTQSVDAELDELRGREESERAGGERERRQEEGRTEGARGFPLSGEYREEKTATPLGRTFSFLRKMAGQRKVCGRTTGERRDRGLREKCAQCSVGLLRWLLE